MVIINRFYIKRLQLSLLTINNDNYFKMAFLFTISFAVTLPLFNCEVFAQESSPTTTNQKQIFQVKVQVTNNEYIDEVGTIHVSIDDTNISKVINGIYCPAKSIISYTLNFNSNDVPVGKGFTVELVYGDDIFKRTYGINGPSNTPEIVQITMP